MNTPNTTAPSRIELPGEYYLERQGSGFYHLCRNGAALVHFTPEKANLFAAAMNAAHSPVNTALPAGSVREDGLKRIREEFEIVKNLGPRACIDSSMMVVTAALTQPVSAPSLTDNEDEALKGTPYEGATKGPWTADKYAIHGGDDEMVCEAVYPRDIPDEGSEKERQVNMALLRDAKSNAVKALAANKRADELAEAARELFDRYIQKQGTGSEFVSCITPPNWRDFQAKGKKDANYKKECVAPVEEARKAARPIPTRERPARGASGVRALIWLIELMQFLSGAVLFACAFFVLIAMTAYVGWSTPFWALVWVWCGCTVALLALRDIPAEYRRVFGRKGVEA